MARRALRGTRRCRRRFAARSLRTRTDLARLDLARAAQAEDDAGIVSAAKKVLAGDIGCDRPYIVDRLLQASEKQPPAARTAILKPQRPPLEAMLDHDIFIAKPICADQRSAVVTTADIDAALGDAAAEKAVLDRAIDAVRTQLGGDLRKDRTAADNLRVYLARSIRR
jgi:hypothetical protein